MCSHSASNVPAEGKYRLSVDCILSICISAPPRSGDFKLLFSIQSAFRLVVVVIHCTDPFLIFCSTSQKISILNHRHHGSYFEALG